MAEQWFRLDADFNDDAKVIRAGWEAACCFVHFLAAAKQSCGVLSDDDMDPVIFSARRRVPLPVATAGLDAMKREGLVAWGSVEWKGPGGSAETRTGWVAPAFIRKGNGPTRTATLTTHDRDTAPMAATLPQVDEGAVTSPYLTEPEPTSHARAVPSRPVPSENRKAPARVDLSPPAPRRHSVHGIRSHLGERSHFVPPLQAPKWVAILDANDDDAIDAAISECVNAGRPASYFLAMFDDDGARVAWAGRGRGRRQSAPAATFDPDAIVS